jgi:ketosteroid isomerase-like protein
VLRQCSFAALGFLLAGCAALRPGGAAQAPDERTAVMQRIAEILHAAETGDFQRLDSYHWYGPHFTKFAAGPGARLDAVAAREAEHKGLKAAAGLNLSAEELKVDVFDGSAVATFVMTANFKSGADAVTKRERGTLVLVKQGGSWRIVHEHFSAAE